MLASGGSNKISVLSELYSTNTQRQEGEPLYQVSSAPKVKSRRGTEKEVIGGVYSWLKEEDRHEERIQRLTQKG